MSVIQDAYILGRLLSHPLTHRANIPDVLRIYEEIRLPFANDVVRNSRLTGLMYEFTAPGYYDGNDRTPAREKEGLQKLGKAIEKNWEWQGMPGDGPDEDWTRAESRLRELAGIKVISKL